MTPIILPTVANVPSNNIEDYSLLIAGPKKIGKTSLAAAAGKNPYIIQGEPKNSLALSYRQNDIISWPDLLEVIMLLEKNPNYCDVKIIDDVPSFYNLCFSFICKKHGFEHPQDLGYGKGWKFVEMEFESKMKRIQNLKGGIIYTAHTQIKEFENRHGGKFNRLETTMTGQADKLLDALVQIWGVMEYNKENERVITIRGNDFIKAGCGIKGRFLYEDGSEIQQIPLGNDANYGWSNIVKGFNNKLAKPTTAKITSVAVKQLAQNTTTNQPIKKPGLKLGKSGL